MTTDHNKQSDFRPKHNWVTAVVDAVEELRSNHDAFSDATRVLESFPHC